MKSSPKKPKKITPLVPMYGRIGINQLLATGFGGPHADVLIPWYNLFWGGWLLYSEDLKKTLQNSAEKTVKHLDNQLSHENKDFTFQLNPGCLIGILIMAYYHPYINQGVLRCSVVSSQQPFFPSTSVGENPKNKIRCSDWYVFGGSSHDIKNPLSFLL